MVANPPPQTLSLIAARSPALVAQDQVSRFLPDHDGWGVGVAPDQGWHVSWVAQIIGIDRRLIQRIYRGTGNVATAGRAVYIEGDTDPVTIASVPGSTW